MAPKGMVVSHLALRRFLGILGGALPLVLIVGGLATGDDFLRTLSTYYYAKCPFLRDIFVGTLFMVGAFLICYRGHERDTNDFWGDDWVTTVAGTGALGIAIFPTAPKKSVLSCAEEAIGRVHDISTLIFLLASTAMVLVLFTKTEGGKKPQGSKKTCNFIYRICGVLMFSFTVALVPLSLMETKIPYVLLALESGAIFAFGAAWFVKGQTLQAAVNFTKRCLPRL